MAIQIAKMLYNSGVGCVSKKTNTTPGFNNLGINRNISRLSGSLDNLVALFLCKHEVIIEGDVIIGGLHAICVNSGGRMTL